MELYANLAIGLAWPIVTIWLVWFLRPEFKILIQRVVSLKMAGGEAVFGKDLDKIENDAAMLRHDSPSKKISIDLIKPKLDQLKRIAEISPRAAILEAWTLVETTALTPETKTSTNSQLSRIELLHHMVTTARLSQEESNLVISLRKLRNQAAHLPDFALTQEEAERYLDLAVMVTEQIENARQRDA